jgi:hypothetical protein
MGLPQSRTPFTTCYHTRFPEYLAARRVAPSNPPTNTIGGTVTALALGQIQTKNFPRIDWHRDTFYGAWGERFNMTESESGHTLLMPSP